MWRLSILLLAIFIFVSSLHARIVHVPDDRPTIQKGINIASNGNTVLVADGTYTGNGNRDIDFLGKAIVVMSENGPEVTIVDCEADSLDPHRGFKFQSGEGSTSVLKGFSIRNGCAVKGGGIYCNSSSPMIINCTFSENLASGLLGNGGGMYNYHSDPTLTNCMFSGNWATNVYANGGGGMFNDVSASSQMVTNCIFIGNSAYWAGGGMLNTSNNLTVTNCTFSGNSAYSGSGMRNQNSNPSIRNCTFIGNSGGMYNYWLMPPILDQSHRQFCILGSCPQS